MTISNPNTPVLIDRPTANSRPHRYKKEGIAATDITFDDNKDKIALLLGRPLGIFSILDEQAKLGRSTDQSFLEVRQL